MSALAFHLLSDSGYVCGSAIPFAKMLAPEPTHNTVGALVAFWTLAWGLAWYLCVVIAKVALKYVLPASTVEQENRAVYEGRNLATVLRALVCAGISLIVIFEAWMNPPKELFNPNIFSEQYTDLGVVLFFTFDLADLILGLFHGLLGVDILLHHCVFITLGILGHINCFAGGHWTLCATVLLSLEVSTPALSYSVTMRNRLTERHWSIKASVLMFAFLFALFRIGLYTGMIIYVYTHYPCGCANCPAACKCAFGLFMAGAALQYYWGILIVLKIWRQIACAPDKQQQPKSKNESKASGKAKLDQRSGQLMGILCCIILAICYAAGVPRGFRSHSGYICGASSPFANIFDLGDSEDSYILRAVFWTFAWSALWYACVFITWICLRSMPQSSFQEENSALYEGRNLATVVRSFVSAGYGIAVLRDVYLNPPNALYEPHAFTLQTTDVGVLLIGTFDLADLILGLFHGLLAKDMIAHHVVFVTLSVISTASCFVDGRVPVMAAVVISTEITTPALSYSMTMRNRLGENHWSVKVSFLMFAILFGVFRIGLYSWGLIYLLVNLRESVHPEWFSIAPFALALLISGAALQYYWGVLIVKKITKQARRTHKAD